MEKTRIRINDDEKTRELIEKEYENSSKLKMCRFAILLSKHIFRLIKYPLNDELKKAFKVNERRQNGLVRMNEVRKESFKVHKLAKQNTDPIVSAALRTAGHALAAPHVKEHAMVASDYAIRVIDLLYPDDRKAVKRERQWQLKKLKEIKDLGQDR